MTARMTDTDTNSREVAAAESGYDIAQAVVTAMTAACLESYHARLEIDFIVNDQNMLWRDSIIRCHGRDGLTAQIHECARCDYPHPVVVMLELACFRLEFLFRRKGDPIFGLQTFHKPEPDIMPGRGVLLPRISQPGYQRYFSGFHIDSEPGRFAGLPVPGSIGASRVIFREVSGRVLGSGFDSNPARGHRNHRMVVFVAFVVHQGRDLDSFRQLNIRKMQ